MRPHRTMGRFIGIKRKLIQDETHVMVRVADTVLVWNSVVQGEVVLVASAVIFLAFVLHNTL